jgi:hypothetical protein
MTRRKISRRKKIRAEFETLTEEEFDTSVGAELGIPRPPNGTATEMIRWLADIGIRSIEDRYPKRRLGRRIGSTKGLPLRDDPRANPPAMKMRRRRARQKLKELKAAIDRHRCELQTFIELMMLLSPRHAAAFATWAIEHGYQVRGGGQLGDDFGVERRPG